MCSVTVENMAPVTKNKARFPCGSNAFVGLLIRACTMAAYVRFVLGTSRPACILLSYDMETTVSCRSPRHADLRIRQPRGALRWGFRGQVTHPHAGIPPGISQKPPIFSREWTSSSRLLSVSRPPGLAIFAHLVVVPVRYWHTFGTFRTKFSGDERFWRRHNIC